jgi:hypothetical protein
MDVGFATGVEDGVSEGVVGAEVSPLGALGAETGAGESATALVVLVSSMCVGPYSVWCCLPFSSYGEPRHETWSTKKKPLVSHIRVTQRRAQGFMLFVVIHPLEHTGFGRPA